MYSSTPDATKRRKRAYRRSARDGKKLSMLHDAKWLIALVILLFIAFRFLIGFSFVDGVSMKPTLQNGEIVLYPRLTRNPQRGDVVGLVLPDGDYIVKRIAAVGGDVVDLKDGVCTINGVPENCPQAVGETYAEEGHVTYPYTVEDGSVFVLGDNREASVDSRGYGTFSLGQIQGVIKWKMGKWYIKAVP